MNKKFWLWFGAVMVFALVFAHFLSGALVELTSEQFVYGGDGCPQSEKYTCGTPPTGGLFSLILGTAIAVVASLPIVRSTL